MSERRSNAVTAGTADDFIEATRDLSDDDFDSLEFAEATTEKALKAATRRRAEERLEVFRLREELGDYDLEFDEDF